MELEYLSIVETLGIDVDRLWQHLQVEPDDQPVICQLLLGASRQDIALRATAQQCQRSEADLRADLERIRHQSLPSSADNTMVRQFKRAEQRIRDRLSSKIYPAFANLMAVPQEDIAGNWVKILNFLYHPRSGYRLYLPPQLNSDNFQSSLGRQVFLPPPDPTVAKSQWEGTQFYQRGLYYQALHAFAAAWNQEQSVYGSGNAEILIYLNNCLFELYCARLQDLEIASYTLAVVVPFHHNQGQVAAEVLRGIAQLQWQTNWRCLRQNRFDRELNVAELPPTDVGESESLGHPLALRVVIVNDPNHVYDTDNPTAERLAALAPELNLMAVVGHYSSEMTAKALPFYALQGLVLINASSTSDTLSTLSQGIQPSFFRLTTPDRANAQALLTYIANRKAAIAGAKVQRLALIYNGNSQYCLSYRAAVRSYIKAHPEQFTLLAESSHISAQPEQIHRYLQKLHNQADILLVIPDGGIEPSSLSNAGLISRLDLDTCLVAGSATFYQNNVLQWMYERCRPEATATDKPIVACIPWHWYSRMNGCQGENLAGQQFCRLGQTLWGVGQLTWRSATAFDALLMVQTTLSRHPCQDREALLRQLHRYFTLQRKSLQGVTGTLKFEGCDRVEPPTEIVTVKPDAAQKQWIWDLA